MESAKTRTLYHICILSLVLAVQIFLIDARTGFANVGGAESAMAKTADNLRLQMEAQKLAERKTEFVVNSQEELVGIMKCTACKRVILQMHSQIIGRLSTEDGAGVKKIEKRISKVIKKVCQHSSITSTPEIVTGCKEFVKENKKLLLETYIPRALEDNDVFEERFPVTQFCRAETTACPEGIQSLDELLGKKIDEQRAEDAKGKSNGKSKKRNVKKRGSPKMKTTSANDRIAKKKDDRAEKDIDQNKNNEDGKPQSKKKRRRRRRRRKRKDSGNAERGEL